MRLVSVYDNQTEAAPVLYRLLAERPVENRVSHEAMPTMEQHQAFIASRPFLYWFLIRSGVYVGAIEATDRNELGVAILREHQRKGYAKEALRLFMAEHAPLPSIPAVRNGRWLANIATQNEGSKAFFSKMGFRPLQETYRYG